VLRPRAVVIPDAREVLLDGHAHARVEVPAELRAEHAGQVMAAAPPGRARRRDVAAGAFGQRLGDPREEASVVRLRPLPAVGIEILPRAAAHVVRLAHVAAEAVADVERVLALRAA